MECVLREELSPSVTWALAAIGAAIRTAATATYMIDGFIFWTLFPPLLGKVELNVADARPLAPLTVLLRTPRRLKRTKVCFARTA